MPSPSPGAEVRRARPLLGTRVEIRAAAAWPRARVHAAIDAAFAAVERVHCLMSFHDPASEVSALNRDAHRCAVRVDVLTYAVLQAAQQLSQFSEGAFDVTVGARLQEWGYLPATAERRRSRRPMSLARVAGEGGANRGAIGGARAAPEGSCSSAASWRDIELLEDRAVHFRRALRIDLGGIAKGYAVDRAVAALRSAGVESGTVNAGGDLRVFGTQPQAVSLRHPWDPARLVHELTLNDEALATSANYFSRCRRGAAEVSALLDPRKGQAYLGRDSVSVRAPDCLSADALTKVVLFAPPALSERVLAAYAAYALVQAPAQVAA